MRQDYRGAAAALALGADFNAGDLTFSVTGDTSGWPTGASGRPFSIVIDRGKASEEKLLCSTLTPTAVTVSIRGYDGTSDASHTAGASVEHFGLSADKADDVDGHVYDTNRDDHAQYVPTDGTRGFFGLNAIADLPVSIGGTANQPGAANTLARSDHVHAIAAGGIDDSGMFAAQVVDSAAIADSSIGTPKLVADSVDATILGPAAVTSGSFAAGAVNTAALGAKAVTGPKFWVAPFVRLTSTAPGACPNNTDTVLVFDTELADTDTMHITTQGRITINTAGIYLVTATVRFSYASSNPGNLATLGIPLNGGAGIARDELGFGLTGTTCVVTLTASTVRAFAVADFLQVQVNQQSGGTLTPTVGSEYSPIFAATWLGNAV